MTTTDTAAEVEPHEFTGADVTHACEACGKNHDHPAHQSWAADPNTRAAASTTPERQPRSPEDGLVDQLAPDDARLDYEEGDAADVLAGIEIHDLDYATWAARKRHRAEVKIAQRAALAADQHARINRWLEDECDRAQRDLNFFDSLLRGFHEKALRDDPKNAKTIRLPDGTELSSQAGKLAVTITDIAALTAWAEANELAEDLLRFPDPEPKKAEIAKRFKSKAEAATEPGDHPAATDDGETVPGITITRKPRSFTISGPKDEDPDA